MAYFTIGQASKETGKAKSTIKKAIDNGELSVAEKTSRGFKIEASELFRVFPRKTAERSENAPNGQADTTNDRIENAVLKVRLELADQRYADAQGVIDELRADRDEWRIQFKSLISDKTEKTRKKWFWQR